MRESAYFSEATHLESQLTFLLECTPEQTQSLTLDPRDFDAYARDNYAVIAEIQSVEHDSQKSGFLCHW